MRRTYEYAAVTRLEHNAADGLFCEAIMRGAWFFRELTSFIAIVKIGLSNENLMSFAAGIC